MQPHPDPRWDGVGAAHPSDQSEDPATGCGQRTQLGSTEQPQGPGVRSPSCLWDARCQIIGRLFLLLF